MGDDATPLSFFNFKKNDKLLILGKPPTMKTDAGWKVCYVYDFFIVFKTSYQK